MEKEVSSVLYSMIHTVCMQETEHLAEDVDDHPALDFLAPLCEKPRRRGRPRNGIAPEAITSVTLGKEGRWQPRKTRNSSRKGPLLSGVVRSRNPKRSKEEIEEERRRKAERTASACLMSGKKKGRPKKVRRARNYSKKAVEEVKEKQTLALETERVQLGNSVQYEEEICVLKREIEGPVDEDENKGSGEQILPLCDSDHSMEGQGQNSTEVTAASQLVKNICEMQVRIALYWEQVQRQAENLERLHQELSDCCAILNIPNRRLTPFRRDSRRDPMTEVEPQTK